MKERVKKPLTVALAAVLVFMALFPVPVGARSLDRARFQEANANPALAAPLIIGTALAACGVYVAGYDIAAYSSNRETISGQFVQFCADNLCHEDIDAATAAIQSAVTPGGAVDMGVLSSLGILGLIPSFESYLVNEGMAVNGSTSNDSAASCLYFEGVPFTTTSNYPEGYQVAASVIAGREEANGSEFCYLSWGSERPYTNGRTAQDFYFNFAKPGTTWTYSNNKLSSSPGGYRVTVTQISDGTNTTKFSEVGFLANRDKAILYSGYDWVMGNNQIVNSGLLAGLIAVTDNAIANNTAAYPTTQVQPFEPTAEQLAAGYDTSAILDAINSNTGTVEGIAAQLGTLAGLLSPVAGIAANVQSIKDAWTNTSTAQTTPFPWLDALWDSLFGILGATPLPDLLSPITLGVQAVQSWIGETPFPTIMQTVIDGVQAIPDGIRNVGDEVLEGLGAIPGAIGTASDVIVGGLQGVLDATLGLAGDIADAIGLEAVADALISPVQGILEAVQASNSPNYQTGTGVALSADAKAEFDAKLLEKAPFCYVKRAQVVGENVAANFGGAASFYVELPFPMMQEPLRVDATPFFAESWGGFTVAQWIRMLLTSVLCAGFIVVAIKVAMRTVGTGAGD